MIDRDEFAKAVTALEFVAFHRGISDHEDFSDKSRRDHDFLVERAKDRLMDLFDRMAVFNERYCVQHGGVGPTPGTNRAKSQGCSCPGDLGWNGRQRRGYAVDELCPTHGVDARRKLDREARAKIVTIMEEPEEETGRE